MVCTRAKTGGGCKYIPVYIEAVEQAMIRHAQTGNFVEPFIDADDRAGALAELELELSRARSRVANLVESMADGRSSIALRNALSEAEADVELFERSMKDAVELAAAADNSLLRKREALFRSALLAASMDRGAVNAIARQIFSKIVIRPEYRIAHLFRKGRPDVWVTVAIDPAWRAAPHVPYRRLTDGRFARQPA